MTFGKLTISIPSFYVSLRHLVEHLDLIEGTSTEDLQSVPEPIPPRQEPPKPMKKTAEAPVGQVAAAPTRQVVAPPVHQTTQAPVRPQKVETTKKPKTLTKKQKEDDVLAKVNMVIPPFSPCRERIQREEV